LPESLNLPFLKDLVPAGLTFGANYLVEFEPQSLWYETMLTLTAEALAESVRTDLHTFSHIPKEVRDSLSRLGVNVASSEEKDLFRVIDSFTVTTGIGIPERRAGRLERYQSKSIHLADWSEAAMHEITEGAPDIEHGRLHLDDNLSVLAQYNDEKALIDYWRTRFVPWSRSLQLSVLHSLTTGVHSASFYNQFETLCDGIFDFQSREAEQGMEHYFRVRTIRGRAHDSRWRQLRLSTNGRVVYDSKERRDKTLGIRGWIKGPK
jgi:KaiC/GvpD/RAD55 family RecA-like ATPase